MKYFINLCSVLALFYGEINATTREKIDPWGIVNESMRMVSVHKKSPTACDYADILNRWYGYPEVCVAQARTPVENNQACDYTVPVVESGAFPGSGHYADGNFPDAVTHYRRLLSYSEDRSVVIISLGFATTLAPLLDTPPEATIWQSTASCSRFRESKDGPESIPSVAISVKISVFTPFFSMLRAKSR